MARYYLTLLQFTSSAEQILFFRVLGNSTMLCVWYEIGDRGSKAKGKNMHGHALNTKRLLEGITLREAGEIGAEMGGIPLGSQPYLSMFPWEHIGQQDNSPFGIELILAGTENMACGHLAVLFSNAPGGHIVNALRGSREKQSCWEFNGSHSFFF